jgi:hypothetical protein
VKFYIVFYEHRDDGQDVAVPDSSRYVNVNDFETHDEAEVEARMACDSVNAEFPNEGTELRYRIAEDAEDAEEEE